jgi:Tol biopolymer transport system component/DNA-binding winged helix-turn-helix (wHTH) protein
MSEQNHYIYEFGPFRLDAQKRVLLRDREPVKLFPKEFDTLLALVERGGEVLDKDDLMRKVWGETIVEESNLSSNISHLRKLLGESHTQHPYIVTIPGRGYRFVAGVKQAFDEVIVSERTSVEIIVEEETGEIGAQDEAVSAAQRGNAGPIGKSVLTNASPAPLLASQPEKRAVAEPAAGRTGRRHSARVIALAAVAVALAALGLYRFMSSRHPTNRQAGPFREMKMTRLTNSGRATRAVISPDGKYVVHVMEEAGGESLWVRQVATASNVQIVPPIQGAYKGLTFSRDGNYVYCVRWEGDKIDRELLQVPVLGGPARKLPVVSNTAIGFSPDGKRFAFVVSHSRVGETLLHIADAASGQKRVLAKRSQPDFFSMYTSPAWSPVGNTIACAVAVSDAAGRSMRLIEISVKDGAEKWIGSRRWESIAQLAWLVDGSGLVLIGSDQPSTPEQVWRLSSAGGEATKITNDLNEYSGVSLTADSSVLVTVQTNAVSSIWVASDEGENLSRAKVLGKSPLNEARATQIASEVGALRDISWTPDGQIVYRSHASGSPNIWMTSPNGSGQRQLTLDARASRAVSVSPDGRYLVFASDRTGNFHIWRANIDGSNLKQLTNGDGELYPHCSPDGRWVVYQQGYGWVKSTLWRVPLEGGQAMQLTETKSIRPFVTPDGKRVAYYYMDAQAWRIGVSSLDDGRLVTSFALQPTVAERIVRWTPDGQAVAYIDSPGGVDNIWTQPLDGSTPVQLTGFKAGKISGFDWSRDGLLAILRISKSSDVILISGFD